MPTSLSSPIAGTRPPRPASVRTPPPARRQPRFVCPACGMVLDRDRNAATNLARLALPLPTPPANPTPSSQPEWQTPVELPAPPRPGGGPDRGHEAGTSARRPTRGRPHRKAEKARIPERARALRVVLVAAGGEPLSSSCRSAPLVDHRGKLALGRGPRAPSRSSPSRVALRGARSRNATSRKSPGPEGGDLRPGTDTSASTIDHEDSAPRRPPDEDLAGLDVEPLGAPADSAGAPLEQAEKRASARLGMAPRRGHCPGNVPPGVKRRPGGSESRE